jgi:hypothetical protein
MGTESATLSKRPPSKASLRRERRAAQEAAFDRRALDHWFEVSGTNLVDLKALIQRYPPVGRNGVRFPGMHAEVAMQVVERREQIGSDAAVYAILFAMQRLSDRSPLLSGEALLRWIGL